MAKRRKTKRRKTAKRRKSTKRRKPAKRRAKRRTTKRKTKKRGTKRRATKKRGKKRSTRGKTRGTKKRSSRKKARRGKKRKPPAAFMAPMQPSPALATVVGSRPLPRTQVIKKVWQYIKRRNLQDPRNRRNIRADANLKKVFKGKKVVSMFQMTKLLNKQLKAA